jgi:hypothetical protein
MDCVCLMDLAGDELRPEARFSASNPIHAMRPAGFIELK